MPRPFNTTFQIDPSVTHKCSYSVKISTTVTLLTPSTISGHVTILTGPSPSELVERAQVGAEQFLTVGVTIGSVISNTHQLYQEIPSGWYVRLETSGNATDYEIVFENEFP